MFVLFYHCLLFVTLFKKKRYINIVNKSVIGIASNLVKVDSNFRKLADHLLGRTIVVRNIDDGIAVSKKYKQSLRIVTLEGELMNPGGSMTGGAFKNTSNLLSRRREIEEFEKAGIMNVVVKDKSTGKTVENVEWITAEHNGKTLISLFNYDYENEPEVEILG